MYEGMTFGEFFLVPLIMLGMFWFLFAGVWDVCGGFITPSWFYENWKLNWFGSWFMFILWSIINPLGTILKLLFAIGCIIVDGIKWLFTVGRSD